jgi:ATP-binding cassette subfamily F protein uup
MLMSAEQISRRFAGRPILDGAELYLNEGDKVGVIGVNGAGKSTLLKILSGTEAPDEGRVTRAQGLRIGYLPQNPVFQPGATVIDQVFLNLSPEARALKRYEAESILTRMGVTDFEALADGLSGGQKKRLALAAALVTPADVLILDEPTNHLDSEMVLWLEKWLEGFKGALVMVTHDRYFLERVVNRIVELERGHLVGYPANYSRYLELKAERQAMEQAGERKRQSLLKKELAWMQRGARARTTKARGRIERFEALSAQQAPEEAPTMTISAASARLGKKTIELKNLEKRFGDKVILKDFSYTVLRDDRIGLIGPNGCGKSTLLNLISGRIQPDSGEVDRGETVNIGYFAQECEPVNGDMRAIDYIKETALAVETGQGRLTASQLMETFLFDGEKQYTPVNRLSGGEKRRLYLLKVLMGAPNILLLDEPTNDLDIETLTILEDYLETFPGAVIAASHDRYFLDKLAQQIFAYEEGAQIGRYVGGYSDYLRLRQEKPRESAPVKAESAPQKPRNVSRRLKFSYKEQREFETIDADIEALEQKIRDVENEIVKNSSDYMALQRLDEEKAHLARQLEEKTERWLYLNELNERILAQDK